MFDIETQNKAIHGLYFFTTKNKDKEDCLIMNSNKNLHELSRKEVERLLEIFQGWLEWQKEAENKEVSDGQF